MSYEAMPCVLKNEDGTPMYGLLIKPLQNQVVFQLAPNQQQQSLPAQQPVVVPSLCQQQVNGTGLSVLTVPSQIPSTSTWNGNVRSTGSNGTTTSAAPTRRHYQNILPRESGSSSKVQQGTPWSSPPNTRGYSNCSGGANNGFAALVQANSRTSLNTVKFAYTTVPSSSPISTPQMLPFLNGNGQQTPVAFSQALSAYGLIPSQQQQVLESNGAGSQLDEQQFGNVYDQNEGDMHAHSLDTGTSSGLLTNDCNSANQNNFGTSGECSSSELDSLLRDIDLNEIRNSLMPLLQDCGADSDDVSLAAFNERPVTSLSTLAADDKNSARTVENADQPGSMATFDGQVEANRAQMASTRPPCRYQGLLSNTSNLRVGCSNSLNPPSAMYSIFDTAVGESSMPICGTNGESTGGVVSMEKASVPNQVVVQGQAISGDYDHVSHEATTPDSGIQSIGDSPHAVPQSSPMQFFSASPDARRRRLSANGTTCNSTAVPQVELSQSQVVQPRLSDFQDVQPSLNQHIADESSTSGTWTQKYMQPLCVNTNTAYFEPISECESSPTVRVPENPATTSHFPSRCYSPSTTSSDCGIEPVHRRAPIGSSGPKRRRRTKKRTSGQTATTSITEFEDMPILQPEGSLRNSPMDIDNVESIRQCQTNLQAKQSDSSKTEKEQLTLNVTDPNALVEKLLSVVPKEQLASLRRILDERLGGNHGNGASTSTATSGQGYSLNRTTSKAFYREPSAVEKTLSRWQSKNAGYASDTSDVSSMADIIGSHVSGKKTMEEEGDSAASSGVRWGDPSHSLQPPSARRTSVSSAGAKKQDPLKKLLEYRAKARTNCVKPTVGTRVNELIPSIIQLHIEGDIGEHVSLGDSMTKACKKMQDRLAILKDVPRLEKETDKRSMPFNNLLNLETEASDDDDEVSSPELTLEGPSERLDESTRNFENPIDNGNSEPTKDGRPALRKKDLATKNADETQDLVQVKENPLRQNISVKIKLSLLRGTSTECSQTRNDKIPKEKPSIVDAEETTAASGKAKRARNQTTLPPKKRFKDGESTKESDATKERSRSKDEDGSRKRRHTRNDLEAEDGSKKQKLALQPVVVLEPLHLEKLNDVASTKNGAGKNKGTKDTTRLFRRCSICKVWLRVEDIGGSDGEGSLCSSCRVGKLGGNDSSGGNSVQNGSASKSSKEKRRKADGKSAKISTIRLKVVTPVKSTNRTVKANLGSKWKYPRKTFVKAGIFSVGDGSSNDTSSVSTVLSPSQCRLLGEGAEGNEFQLPYDFWYHHRYQKGLQCDNPSQNYKKLRSNVYVDPKPAAAVKHHVCNCKLPVDGSGKACGDNCLNRLMYTECCVSSCPCGDQCTNNRFQKREWISGLQVFESGTGKGMGLKTKEALKKGTFLCEYLGEVVSTKTFGERMATWYKDCAHHYALNLDAGMIIDGYRSGSVARFINHSCQPNCEIQKWWVNGHYRIGVFALRDIKLGEELTYDYKFHAFSTPQACLCGTDACSGFVDGSSRSDRANHQARKSVPKRSDAKQDQSDASANKSHLLKPMSHRERVTVVKARLFLLRNVDGLRRKLQALNASSSETAASVDDEKRKAEIISSQLTALKTSRSVRTRRSALSENDAQIQKLTGLVQLLKSVVQTLTEARDKDGRPLLTRFKKSVRSPKKQSTSNGQQHEGLDFALLERNVEKGLYKTPEAFDRDVKSLLNCLKINANGEESATSVVSAVEELRRIYESTKETIAEQLRDALGFQLSPDFLPSQPIDIPKKSGEKLSEQVVQGVEACTDDLYWDSTKPYMVNNEVDDSAYATLWERKADAYDEEDDKVHCICGICEDDGIMIQCDRCRYWQHSECVGVSGEQEEYVCEFCTSGKQTLFKDVILSPQPEIRLQHCVYYKSLMKSDLQVRVGECIYVKKNIDEKHKQLLRNFNRQCVQTSRRGEVSIPADDGQLQIEENGPTTLEAAQNEQTFYRRSELRVFRVERLFTGPKDVKFVFGYYFARPNETFCEPSRRFYRNEIFVTPLYDTLPLDAVVGRCLVVDGQTFGKGRPKYPKYADEDVYICEYRLDKAQRLFDKMHARNRYPVCTKPYIFRTFDQKLKVKRDYTPFNTRPKISSASKKGDQGKKSKMDARSDQASDVVDKKRLSAKKEQKRFELLIEKLKRLDDQM